MCGRRCEYLRNSSVAFRNAIPDLLRRLAPTERRPPRQASCGRSLQKLAKPMILRLFFAGLFLVAVAVLPYFSSEWMKSSSTASGGEGSAQGATSLSGTAPVGAGIATPITGIGGPPVGSARPDAPPIVALSEAIRFNVTPAWLFGRWPRVTTGLPDGEFQGYRVPLVSGTREDDVTGSLTYYFNARQVCQKITLVGATGDVRKITGEVVGRFGLRRQTSDDAGLHLYQTRWNGKPVSQLKIKAAPVVKASEPLARYQIDLVLYSWQGR
jgi:hypothetical protein